MSENKEPNNIIGESIEGKPTITPTFQNLLQTFLGKW